MFVRGVLKRHVKYMTCGVLVYNKKDVEMPQLTRPSAVTGIAGLGPARLRPVRARTPRESNIYARIGNHPICSGLSCVPTFSLIPTPAGGRTGAAGCILASSHLRLRGVACRAGRSRLWRLRGPPGARAALTERHRECHRAPTRHGHDPCAP